MVQESANFNRKNLLIIIAVLIPIAFFLRLNSYQLLFEEPRRALVALEMLIADNWIVPTTNGTLYYNKPPFYNWVLMGFLNILGTAEWVVRLPSILSLFATGILHYYFSKKYIGHSAALLSALFYISSADILFYFSLLGEIDLFYALLVYLQAILIFHFYQKGKIHWLYLSSYTLTAAGVLTKGFPSLFFQAITLLVIFLLNKDFKKLFSVWHGLGILVLLLTAGSYFYVYDQHHDVDRYLARLFTETFSRTGMERGIQESLMHLINFPVMVLKIAAPWVLLFLVSWKWNWRLHLKSNPFLRFCLWFCIANGILYLLSPGTRERYLYMFYPFIFSLLSYSLISQLEINQLKIKKFYIFLCISIIAGLVGMGIFGMTLGNIAAGVGSLLLGALVTVILLKLRLTKSISWILAAVGIFLIGRIGFDLVILPTKKQQETYKVDAQKMAAIIGEELIFLSGPPEHKIDDVQFAGNDIAVYERDEPTYLAFQTSFYLSAYTGKILKYTTEPSQNGFYISKEGYVDSGSNRIFYRFNNRSGKQDQWYVLYKKN